MAEEIIPTGLYKVSKGRVGRPRNKLADKHFGFLRDGAVKEAVEKMRNKNQQPVVIHAARMPVGMMSHDWNNKADCVWNFTAHYLAEEGVVRSSDLARAVVLYNFHGTYQYKRKIKKKVVIAEKPIVHGLHFKLTNNRSVLLMDAKLLVMAARMLWLLGCYGC